MLSGYRALDQILIQILEDRYQIRMRYFLNSIQNLLVALLRNNSFRRITAAARRAEQLLKNVLQIQLSAPAKVLQQTAVLRSFRH